MIAECAYSTETSRAGPALGVAGQLIHVRRMNDAYSQDSSGSGGPGSGCVVGFGGHARRRPARCARRGSWRRLEAQPEVVAAARAAAMTPDQPDQSRENAVSKVDKNSFVVIGNVFFYDTDFFSDGTPVTVGVLADVKKPLSCRKSTSRASRQSRRDLPLARPPSARRLAAGRRRGRPSTSSSTSSSSPR